MSKLEKLLARILSGTADTNIDFRDLCKILESLGFSPRIRGDHHIFSKPEVEEIINLQPRGSKAKPYQVKPLSDKTPRNLILRYHLGEQYDQ